METRYMEEVVKILKSEGYDAECIEDKSRTGITVKGSENRSLPESWNMQMRVYAEYMEGMTPEEAAAEIIREFHRSKPTVSEDMRRFERAVQERDFDSVKDMLTLQAINLSNLDVLSKAPYMEVCDLGIICRFLMGEASVIANYDVMDIFGLTKEELFHAAMEETKKKTSVCDMETMLNIEDFGLETTQKLFVLHNPTASYASGAILIRSILENIREKLGDFYIIPSSIHELLLLSTKSESDTESLQRLIQNINESQVAPEDRLSDHLYKYTGGAVQIAR